MKSLLFTAIATLGLGLGSGPGNTLHAASFSEPPVVIYGKVIQVGSTGSQQIYSGELRITLVREDDPSHVVTRSVRLGPSGPQNSFSYRAEIPIQYLPTEQHQSESLSVSDGDTVFRVQGIAVNGLPASVLDSQLPTLTTRFRDRATLHRFDLRLIQEHTDTDTDGIPDWWEDLHRLNRHSRADALGDPDGDSLSNLDEFRLGTDPVRADLDPQVKTTSILVPTGGRAGLHLTVIAPSYDLASALVAYTESVPGVAWWRSGSPIAPGEDFPYSDMLDGRITLTADGEFAASAVAIRLRIPGETAYDSTFTLQLLPVSPSPLNPAVWLQPGNLDESGPIEDWADASGNGRDAFSPVAARRPQAVAGQEVLFANERFLFLDDRDLNLTSFTAFLAFDVSGWTPANQALLGHPGLQIHVGGATNGLHARSLFAQAGGAMVPGPLIEVDQFNLLTVGHDSAGLFLARPNQHHGHPVPSSRRDLSTFTTLGALQGFSEAQPQDFLQGGIRELIVFDRALDAAERARIDDYRRARWEGQVLWDLHQETIPQVVHGSATDRNILVGGWADDELVGGSSDDVLRGGPGADRLTGGAGADCFEVFIDSGNDTVSDFSIADGDRLDLRGIYAGKTGAPDRYLRLRVVTTRATEPDSSPLPLRTTLLELNHDGDGGAPDQVITLQNLSLGDADLRRLVGEETIVLGGPRFPTTVRLATAETNWIETEAAREIQVTREGNTEAAIEVHLSFTGTAEIDGDYRVEDARGSGPVRTVSFARGQSSAVVRLIPVPDTEFESESLAIQVMPDPSLSDIPDSPLIVTLNDASYLTIHTLRHAKADSDDAGIVQITRSGRMDASLTVPLELGGTLINGFDCDPLPEAIAFAPGDRVKKLEVRLRADRASTNPVDEIRIHLAQDDARYALVDPRTASVLALPALSQPPRRTRNGNASNPEVAERSSPT